MATREEILHDAILRNSERELVEMIGEFYVISTDKRTLREQMLLASLFGHPSLNVRDAVCSALTEIQIGETETLLGLGLVYANKYYDTYFDADFAWNRYKATSVGIATLMAEINAHLGLHS